MSNGLIDIQVERCRQIAVEGWSLAVDDKKATGELMAAAECYYRSAVDGWGSVAPPNRWPWDATQWKPKTAREDLVRAGALYLAEAEKTERLGGGNKPRQSALRLKADTCAWVIDFFDANGRLPSKVERQKRHIGAGRKAA